MTHRRPTIWRAMNWLIVGFIATLATATLCGPVERALGFHTGKLETVSVDEETHWGAWEIGRIRANFETTWLIWFPGSYERDSSEDLKGSSALRDNVPPWVSHDRKPVNDRTSVRLASTTAAGWPFHAATYVEWDGVHYPPDKPFGKAYAKSVSGIREGLHLHTFRTASGDLRIVLPLRPIVGGLIGDVLFWAAVVGLVSMRLEAAKRARRRRKGCCTACGYDLRGSAGRACPECGAALAPGPAK